MGVVSGIVLVKYGRVVDLDAARRCVRCLGGGRERYGPAAGDPCPRCEGTGVHPDGWAYRTGGLALLVGDVVEVPPTPRSALGVPQLATVVLLDAEHPGPRSAVLRVVTS